MSFLIGKLRHLPIVKLLQKKVCVTVKPVVDLKFTLLILCLFFSVLAQAVFSFMGKLREKCLNCGQSLFLFQA